MDNDKHEKAKRKRSTNWVEEDKLLLKDLVKERVADIENKNTDTNTNHKKKKAWEDLEESFNSMCHGSKRNLLQLKSQWNVTKILARKEISSQRRERQKTGGGPQATQREVSSDDISIWLPNEFIIDSNEFDSDVALSEIPKVNKNSEAEEQFDVLVDTETGNQRQQPVETQEQTGGHKVVDTETGKQRQQPVETQEQTGGHKVVEDGPKNKKRKPLGCVADNQIKEVATFDMKCRDELHKLQLANEERKARNLDLEHKLLLKQYEFLEAKIEFQKILKVSSE